MTDPNLHDAHAVGDQTPAPSGLGLIDRHGSVWMRLPDGWYDHVTGERLALAQADLAEAHGPVTEVRIVPADAVVLPADPHAAIDHVFGHYSNVVSFAAGPVIAESCEPVGDADCIHLLAVGTGLVEPGAASIHMRRGTARDLLDQLAEALGVIVLGGPVHDLDGEIAAKGTMVRVRRTCSYCDMGWDGFLFPAEARNSAAHLALAAANAERGQQ